MKRYIIKIWENEQARDLGESTLIATELSDIRQAIEKAKIIMKNQNFASLEVQDAKQTKSYYFCTQDEEKTFEDEVQKAVIQERVNINAIAVGKIQLFADDENMRGKVEDIIKELKKNQEYINTPENDIDEEMKEFLNSETDTLVKSLEENHDSQDYIELFEHPMAGFFVERDSSEILQDLLQEYMEKITETNLKDIPITSVIATYYEMNGIYNLSEYGDDKNIEISPSFSNLYRDLCKYMGIEIENITTNEERPGKYQTNITFQNNNSATVTSKGRYKIDDIAYNMQIIRDSYTMELNQSESDMEIE